MKVTLTGYGSFADAYLKQDSSAQVASIRELGQASFIKVLSESDVIIHNAATLKEIEAGLLIERNFDFTRLIVDTLRDHNPSSHLIFLSSMSMLDPTDDKAYGDVLSMSPYAYSKYLAETYTLRSNLENVSCVRFSTLFYREPEKDGLSKMIFDAAKEKRITLYNHGEARRNFLPLSIAVQYVEKISSLTKTDRRTYNLADKSSTSFLEVADILKDYLKDIRVEDLPLTDSQSVLADFHSYSIDTLIPIDFSLREEIISYAKELLG